MQWFLELRDELEVKCRVGHPAKIRARTTFPRSGCPRPKSETYEPCCATVTRGCGGAPECSTGCRQSHSITPCDDALPDGVQRGRAHGKPCLCHPIRVQGEMSCWLGTLNCRNGGKS